jgi:hypothetical protein
MANFMVDLSMMNTAGAMPTQLVTTAAVKSEAASDNQGVAIFGLK